MITGPEMQRRAIRVVTELERKVKLGTATDAERERYQAGLDHVLVFDWSKDAAPPSEVMPPLPEEPMVPLDARVVGFCDWWERVQFSARWFPDSWRIGLLYWWHPRPREALTWGLECQAEDELLRRDEAAERRNEGMIVTDLEAA